MSSMTLRSGALVVVHLRSGRGVIPEYDVRVAGPT